MCEFVQWTLNFSIIQCLQFTTRRLILFITWFHAELKHWLYFIFLFAQPVRLDRSLFFSLCFTLLQTHIQSFLLALTTGFLSCTIKCDRWSTNQPTTQHIHFRSWISTIFLLMLVLMLLRFALNVRNHTFRANILHQQIFKFVKHNSLSVA